MKRKIYKKEKNNKMNVIWVILCLRFVLFHALEVYFWVLFVMSFVSVFFKWFYWLLWTSKDVNTNMVMDNMQILYWKIHILGFLSVWWKLKQAADYIASLS